MLEALLLSLVMQSATANLSVTATVVRSCQVSAPVPGGATTPSVACGEDAQQQIRVSPGSTHHGPVVVIDF